MKHAAFVSMLLLVASAVSRAGETIGTEFFEKKVRPVLAEHCYKCHSAKSEKLKGKLRVDTRAALLKGGESGPGIVPGNPDKSLFIEAVLYTNQDLQMPPKTKLPEDVLQNLVAWVKSGAPWPEESGTVAAVEEKTTDYEKLRKEHWAFKPIQRSEPPQVNDSAWTSGPIDRFTLAKLEQKNIKPSPGAEKHALLRRVSFNLTGLPPTPDEIDAFLKDTSPDAFTRVVDRLLASPRFGERWGRHWLDIAHYAESAGGGRIVALANAWRYRDYVVDAFNSDKPYDVFLKEQLAGDLLPAATPELRREQLIATGFLVVGPKNLDTQDKDLLRMDVVDDQVDTIGKALLGMTIGCARCHDHKFDPIPTKEYYALAGIFRNTKTLTPGNVSGVAQAVLPGDAASQEKIAEYEKQLALLEDKLHKLRTAEKPKTTKPVTSTTVPPAVAAPVKFKGPVEINALPGIVADNSEANIIGTWIKSTYIKIYVGDGYIHDNNKAKGEMSVSFAPALPKTGMYEVRFAYTANPNRAERVPIIIQHADGEVTVEVNEREEPAVDGLFVSLGRFRFKEGNDGSVTVSNMGTSGSVIVDAVQFLPLDEGAVNAPAASATPVVDAGQQTAAKTFEAEAAQLKKLEEEIKQFKKTAPPGPAALAVHDEEQVSDYNVCIRGDVHRLGEAVPRGFLSIVPVKAPSVNAKQSGRVELAQWLTDPANPLPARVMVNRIWHHLFGAGLVRSTDNFGVTGEKPSHPELLDFLAARFVENGWSVKKLVREIVLSRTWQQAVYDNAAAAKADPENRLLWRANRRRLEIEAIRDAILANSGKLELNGSPGATVKAEKGKSVTRTLYLPLQREEIDEILEVFDFADTNLVIGVRNTSNLPTQSLYLMNSPFVIEQAQAAARRLLQTPGISANSRVISAYLHALGRPPNENEMKLSRAFLPSGGESESAATINAWGQFYQSLFACVDFRYMN